MLLVELMKKSFLALAFLSKLSVLKDRRLLAYRQSLSLINVARCQAALFMT